MDTKIKQDYMDIDEFLSSRGVCSGLAFPESDYTDDDFNSIPDNAEFDGNLGQLQMPPSVSEFGGEIPPSPGSLSSDEGRGASIGSESVVSGQSSGAESSAAKSKKRKNTANGKNPKRTRTQRSKAKANNSKASSGNQLAAAAVDINGVKCSYSIEPGTKTKRQKILVPGENKDEKYWERRLKNNVAAKRSRDLKRQKEVTVAHRAENLEIENEKLKNEVKMLKKRLDTLNGKLDETENES